MIINPYNVMYRRFERIKNLPTLASSTITFNGSNQSPTINNYNSNSMVLSGDTSVRDVGNYTITVTPAEGWAWNDGTQTPISFNYSITKMSLAKPYLSNASKTFNNGSQSPTVNDYNSTWENQSGTTSSTNVGSWTVTWSLKEPTNTEWSDGTVANVTGSWSIAVLKLTKPTYKSGSATYDGKAKTLAVNNYNSTYMTQGGTTSATNAGSYTATYTLKSTTNTKWADNTTAAVSVSWSIARAKLATKPTVKTNPTYNGKAQSPTWNNYNTTYMTIGGTTSTTNAGNCTATFTLKANYAWTDGTTAVASVVWTMQRLKVTKPTVKTNPTYNNGSSVSPTWNNYNTTYMTIGGTTSGTTAGTYKATFTLKSNWAWSDGGTGVLTVSWTLQKATGSITLNPTSVSVAVGSTVTFTITRAGNGAITVTSGATGTATVSLSSTTVTVKGVAIGSATITVSVAAGTNHNATSKTLTATVKGANIYIWGQDSSGNKYEYCRYGFGQSDTGSTTWKQGLIFTYADPYSYWYDQDGTYHNGEWDVDNYIRNGSKIMYSQGGNLIVRMNRNPINLSGYNKLRFRVGLWSNDSSDYRSKNNSMYREASFFITTTAKPTAKTGKVYTIYSATSTMSNGSGTQIRAYANYDMDISSLTGNQYLFIYLQGSISSASGGGFYRYGISLGLSNITTQTASPQNLYALLFN